MNIPLIIHELIVTRAMLAHQHSGHRAIPWDRLPPDQVDLFMSHARCSVEPMLLPRVNKHLSYADAK